MPSSSTISSPSSSQSFNTLLDDALHSRAFLAATLFCLALSAPTSASASYFLDARDSHNGVTLSLSAGSYLVSYDAGAWNAWGFVIGCDGSHHCTKGWLNAFSIVPTIDGRVRMRLPPGTQSGRILRLRGKGAFNNALNSPSGASDGRGDQHVKIVVEVPTHLGVREQAVVENLVELEGETYLPMHAEFWRHFGS